MRKRNFFWRRTPPAIIASLMAGQSARGMTIAGNQGSILSSFTPCAAPRFDAFSEQLVCSWIGPSGDDRVPVEEVMRSCGGAVQGIREQAVMDQEKKEGLYLNRANDGFIFFDSGSYSSGPLSLPSDDLVVGNFILGKSSRLLLTSISSVKSFVTTHRYLRKTFGGSDLVVPTIEWVETNPSECVSVSFTSVLQCSMPTRGQSWNLQRAKWSKLESGNDNGDTPSEAAPEQLLCWISSDHVASTFLEWAGITPSSIGGSYDPEGTCIHMGVLCESTGSVQSMARIYGKAGKLSNVLLCQGKRQ